ncbi:hypothetical protein [Floridanema aerugineum]|uniref:Uncharacterized protein n=1 Tax=Floridaenema aerugineum BLCC-F46 TaxID=3153654 RepID=A0ABV4XES5_9CYAN
MPLPESFGSWEHLLKIIRNFHNWRVRDFFKHDRYDRHVREPRIDRPVNNLMQACIIGPNDSAIVVLVRVIFFEISLGNAARLQPIYYGLPVQPFDEDRMDDHPQILLYFEEDLAVTPDGFSRVQAHINFRLMDETPSTMTQTKAKVIANKIKAAFGVIPTWDFTKGKYIYSYQDRKKGYWLQIYAINKTEAVGVIKKILSIQGHEYDEDRLKESNAPGKQSNNNPGSHVIYGQTVRKKRYRPEKKVRFRYALLKLDGFGAPIVLYDPYHRCNISAIADN